MNKKNKEPEFSSFNGGNIRRAEKKIKVSRNSDILIKGKKIDKEKT